MVGTNVEWLLKISFWRLCLRAGLDTPHAVVPMFWVYHLPRAPSSSIRASNHSQGPDADWGLYGGKELWRHIKPPGGLEDRDSIQIYHPRVLFEVCLPKRREQTALLWTPNQASNLLQAMGCSYKRPLVFWIVAEQTQDNQLPTASLHEAMLAKIHGAWENLCRSTTHLPTNLWRPQKGVGNHELFASCIVQTTGPSTAGSIYTFQQTRSQTISSSSRYGLSKRPPGYWLGIQGSYELWHPMGSCEHHLVIVWWSRSLTWSFAAHTSWRRGKKATVTGREVIAMIKCLVNRVHSLACIGELSKFFRNYLTRSRNVVIRLGFTRTTLTQAF